MASRKPRPAAVVMLLLAGVPSQGSGKDILRVGDVTEVAEEYDGLQVAVLGVVCGDVVLRDVRGGPGCMYLDYPEEVAPPSLNGREVIAEGVIAGPNGRGRGPSSAFRVALAVGSISAVGDGRGECGPNAADGCGLSAEERDVLSMDNLLTLSRGVGWRAVSEALTCEGYVGVVPDGVVYSRHADLSVRLCAGTRFTGAERVFVRGDAALVERVRTWKSTDGKEQHEVIVDVFRLEIGRWCVAATYVSP